MCHQEFMATSTLPTLPLNCTPDEFTEAYGRSRAVLLRGGDIGSSSTGSFLERLRRLQHLLVQSASASFTVENAPLDTPTFSESDSLSRKRRRKEVASMTPSNGPQTAQDLLSSPKVPAGIWYA